MRALFSPIGLALLAGLPALGALLAAANEVAQTPFYLGASGLALAVLALTLRHTGAFLGFLTGLYTLGYAVLVLLWLLQPLLPPVIAALVPPALTAFTAAAFGIIGLVLPRVPIIRTATTLTDQYFSTTTRRALDMPGLRGIVLEERTIAAIRLATLILINLGQVAISVQLSYWGRDWIDSIQNKNAPEFWRLLFWVWVPWVALAITSNVIEFSIMGAFRIRWREWTTLHMLRQWLDNGTHYRLSFTGGVDNPDQRIQEDVRKYVDLTYDYSISLIQQISSLISFAVILWGLSAALTLPGTDTKIPGLLFWVGLLYATLGTYLAHKIGRRLIPLNYDQEHYEANFRFGLARLREFAEPVALLHGEKTEQARLSGQISALVLNYFRIVSVRKWLTGFTQLYGASNGVIPYVVAAPFYFVGQISFGVLNQTAQAFGRVDNALSFFIDRYAQIAEYKAVIDRLSVLEQGIHRAKAIRESTQILRTAQGEALHIPDLALSLPNGRQLTNIRDLTFAKGEATLLVGPSGSGKSTIFRAIAGLWPFGTGHIQLPEGGRILLLPQRPYIPIGTIRAGVNYPDLETTHSDTDIRAALEAVGLSALSDRLDEAANWSQVLSGGEQQRLALARALLAKPDWLLLDEASSALDDALEDRVYRAIATLLPTTTVISIGHRASLIALHKRKLTMTPIPDTSESLNAHALSNTPAVIFGVSEATAPKTPQSHS